MLTYYNCSFCALKIKGVSEILIISIFRYTEKRGAFVVVVILTSPRESKRIAAKSKRIERSESSRCTYRSSDSSFVFQRHSRARIRVKGAFSYWRAAQHVENPRRAGALPIILTNDRQSLKHSERFGINDDRLIFTLMLTVNWLEDKDN